MRRFTRIPASPMILLSDSLYCANSKLVIKPRLPSEKDKIGGTMRWKSQLVNSTVPSPPRVKTRSNFSGDSQHRSGVQYRSILSNRLSFARSEGTSKRFDLRSL